MGEAKSFQSRNRFFAVKATKDKQKNIFSPFRDNQTKDLEKAKYPIKEFFLRQKEFHKHIKMFVTVLSDAEIQSALSPDERAQLNIFLTPYREILSNPFDEDFSALQKALTQIKEIINPTNLRFGKMMAAFELCMADCEVFRNFIQEIKIRYPVLFQKINEVFYYYNQRIDDYLIKPAQHFMRYKLLAEEINKNLDKKSKHFTEMVTVISYLDFKIKKENERINFIMLANEVCREFSVLKNTQQKKLTNIEIVAMDDALEQIKWLIDQKAALDDKQFKARYNHAEYHDEDRLQSLRDDLHSIKELRKIIRHLGREKKNSDNMLGFFNSHPSPLTPTLITLKQLIDEKKEETKENMREMKKQRRTAASGVS